LILFGVGDVIIPFHRIGAAYLIIFTFIVILELKVVN